MKPHTALIAALCLILATANLGAQAIEPDVQKLLDDSAAAYRGASAFSATITTEQTSGPVQRKVTTKLTMQKANNKLNAEIVSDGQTSHVVADGTDIYSDSSRDATKYMKEPVDQWTSVISALGRGGGFGLGLLPILFTSTNAQERMIPGTPGAVKHAADETIDGQACDVITATISQSEPPTKFGLAIGKTDHLIRRLTITRGDEKAQPMIVETHTAVSLSPTVSDATFKYTPAAGAVVSAPPAEPDMFDPRLKVGASPLAFGGKDLAGKDVSLDQYKGKVVLIDFWATWCGPCVAELPNVIAAYEKFHGQGFEIIGVSLDQAEDKAKLEAFIAEKKMPWRQVYDGKYWEAANAKAWGVQAIPFTVLIGRDGKIAAVSARGEQLAPAIEAALKDNK